MNEIKLNPLAESTVRRLSESTRNLAREYLTGKYRARLRDAGFQMTDSTAEPVFSPERRHGKNAILTARESPLDILLQERLAGSASNIAATFHEIPGLRIDGGKVSSISHTTVDFGDAVRLGLAGLERGIRQRLATPPGNEPHHREFLLGLLDVIEAMRIWTKRYIAAYEELLASPAGAPYASNIRQILANLRSVPENPPATFPEAVQSLWSFFEFQRLCGNWSGIGRIDEILGPWLETDLKNGSITLEEAREWLAHFWIKGTEWCFGLREGSASVPGSGDAQNYQNIILGGVDENGNPLENEVTFLVLDVIEELHISDYPVAVRLNRHTSERLLRRIADVQLLGGGIVSVYREDQVLAGLQTMGFPEQVARRFTNDGCWEVIIPGETQFSYLPQDALLPFQEALFDRPPAADFEELYRNYLERFRALIERVRKQIAEQALPGKISPDSYPSGAVRHADVVLSLLEPSCRRNMVSYTLHGTGYVIRAIHLAGLPDVANSLYAIRELVFRKKRISLAALIEVLRNDWRGAEPLRLEFANSLRYYGNDNPEMDAILRRVFDDSARIAGEVRRIGEITVTVGVSTFGREIEFAPHRMATAFGKHAGEYLAPNLSPTPGTDKSSVSAVLNSYSGMNFLRTPNGCPLDLRLDAGIRKAPDAAGVLTQLLRVFLEKGGFYLQIDTVDVEMLRAAKRDPDRFPNLVVRISGWSARFASLSEEWQDLIINRTALGFR